MGVEPQARVLLDSLLAVWQEPAAVLNADGTVRALGPAAERHLGWSTADLQGRRLADVLIPSEDHHRLPQRLLGDGRGRIAGVESRVGLTFRRRDGSTFTGEVVVGELLGGPDAGMIAVVRPDTASHDRELFQLIFRGAPDIISIVDRDRGQLLVNEAAERLLGHNMSRLEDNRSMVHPDDIGRVQADLAPREDGFGGPVRYRVRTIWGDWRWLESNSTDLRDTPPVSGILVFTRDVTAEVLTAERLTASTARMVALVTGLEAGIVVEDEDARTVSVNEALINMFALDDTRGEIAGRPVGEVMKALSARFEDPDGFLEEAGRGGAGQSEWVREWPLADGRTVEVDSAPIVADDVTLGRLWAFRDVTARVAAEARRERMMSMEKEARRAAEEQNERLSELDRVRSQLVATVSHELRTPLTPIASQVELLLDGYPDPLTPGQRSAVEVIDRNLDRLRRLVDDLLTVRRVEQGMLEIHSAPVEVASLVAAQAEQFRPHAERVGVSLTCRAAPGPRLMADADRLGTIIDNLLANALKFTPRGGRVEVRAGAADGWWEIRVTDTGRGIAARDLSRVFDPFFRTADSESEGLPGSGLGLAVTRALVEGHGGDISVESMLGEGSSFLVRLPVTATP